MREELGQDPYTVEAKSIALRVTSLLTNHSPDCNCFSQSLQSAAMPHNAIGLHWFDVSNQ